MKPNFKMALRRCERLGETKTGSHARSCPSSSPASVRKPGHAGAIVENFQVTEKSGGRENSAPPQLNNFIDERVVPLAKMFAHTPLMSLRIETPEGTVTFERAAENAGRASATVPELILIDQVRPAQRHARLLSADLTPDSQPGEPYDTVNAEIVGVFHPAPNMPTPGELVEDGQVLGHIDALKLQNPVRNPKRGVFVAQIVEDGQAVDFGEALFVIDHREPTDQEQPQQEAEALEPPRL